MSCRNRLVEEVRSKFVEEADLGDPQAMAVVALCEYLQSLMANGDTSAPAQQELETLRDGLLQAFSGKKRNELEVLLSVTGSKLRTMQNHPTRRDPTPFYREQGWVAL